MRIHRHGPAEAALAVAEDVAALLEEGPLGDGKGSLLLPTGSTPRLLYARLREGHAAGKLATGHWSSFNLDEYWPCAADNATSFSAFMHEELFTPLGLPPERCGLLGGHADVQRDRRLWLLAHGAGDARLHDRRRDGKPAAMAPGGWVGSGVRDEGALRAGEQ